MERNIKLTVNEAILFAMIYFAGLAYFMIPGQQVRFGYAANFLQHAKDFIIHTL